MLARDALFKFLVEFHHASRWCLYLFWSLDMWRHCMFFNRLCTYSAFLSPLFNFTDTFLGLKLMCNDDRVSWWNFISFSKWKASFRSVSSFFFDGSEECLWGRNVLTRFVSVPCLTPHEIPSKTPLQKLFSSSQSFHIPKFTLLLSISFATSHHHAQQEAIISKNLIWRDWKNFNCRVVHILCYISLIKSTQEATLARFSSSTVFCWVLLLAFAFDFSHFFAFALSPFIFLSFFSTNSKRRFFPILLWSRFAGSFINIFFLSRRIPLSTFFN